MRSSLILDYLKGMGLGPAFGNDAAAPRLSHGVNAYTTNQLRNGLSLVQPNASVWVQAYNYDDSDHLAGITSPAGAFAYLCPFTNRLYLCSLKPPRRCQSTTTKRKGTSCRHAPTF